MVLLLVFFVLFFSPVFSLLDWKTADCQSIAYEQTTFNLTELVNDSKAFSFVNDEIVNLTVFREGPPFQMSGKVTNNIVTEFQCTTRTDATITVYIQQDAIAQLNQSTNQVEDFIALKENGGIKVETHSLGASAKVAVGEFILFFGKLLGITQFF